MPHWTRSSIVFHTLLAPPMSVRISNYCSLSTSRRLFSSDGWIKRNKRHWRSYLFYLDTTRITTQSPFLLLQILHTLVSRAQENGTSSICNYVPFKCSAPLDAGYSCCGPCRYAEEMVIATEMSPTERLARAIKVCYKPQTSWKCSKYYIRILNIWV